MTATISTFPTGRCRPPASAAELADREAYARAARGLAAGEWHGPSVRALVDLAVDGVCDVTREKAQALLAEQ